jgi:putative flippase GtrA
VSGTIDRPLRRVLRRGANLAPGSLAPVGAGTFPRNRALKRRTDEGTRHPVSDPATLGSGGSAGKQGVMESLRKERNGVLAERRYEHLIARLLHPDLLRFLRFAVVGGSGVLINMVVLWLLHDKVGLPLTRSSVAAISLAIMNNFLWNNFWTFKATTIQTRRFAQFVIISLIGMAINLAILNILFAFDMHYALANLAGIMVATAWNFFANSKWTWGAQ